MELYIIHIVCSLREAPATVFAIKRHAELEEEYDKGCQACDGKGASPYLTHLTQMPDVNNRPGSSSSCLKSKPDPFNTDLLYCTSASQLPDGPSTLPEILMYKASPSQSVSCKVPINNASSSFDVPDQTRPFTSVCSHHDMSSSPSFCFDFNAHISQLESFKEGKSGEQIPDWLLRQSSDGIFHGSKTNVAKSISSCKDHTSFRDIVSSSQAIKEANGTSSDYVFDTRHIKDINSVLADSCSSQCCGGENIMKNVNSICDKTCSMTNDQTKGVIIKCCSCQTVCEHICKVKNTNTLDQTDVSNELGIIDEKHSCEKTAMFTRDRLCNYKSFVCLDLPLTNFGFYSEDVTILF